MDGTVLIADDDRTIRTVLTQAFTRAGCKVHATSSLVTLMRWVEEGKGDLVITDVMMPDGNGIELVPKITEIGKGLPVIVISAQNTIMTAIKATEVSAFDYLPKPFDLPDLMKRSARALAVKRRLREPAPLSVNETSELPLVGRTTAMQELYHLIAKIVNSDLSVFISGESGTGKSLIARTIHDFSDRRDQPFVVANARDLSAVDGPERMLARAGTGTLVIDEVGDLEIGLQGQVARSIDRIGGDGPKIMATSQVDLLEKMDSGEFRQDLYYRLNGVRLVVPALRDRVDDIHLLIEFFLSKDEKTVLSIHQLSKEALKLMRSYSWPGNVRQLENCVLRLSATSTQAEITKYEVEQALGGQPEIGHSSFEGRKDKLSASIARHLQRYFDQHGGTLPPQGLYARILHEMEQPLLEIALDATGGNQAKCAELLGINRNTLRKKISELEIHVTRRRKLM